MSIDWRRATLSIVLAAAGFSAMALISSLASATPTAPGWLLVFIPTAALGRLLSKVAAFSSRWAYRLAAAALFGLPSFLFLSWLLVPRATGTGRIIAVGSTATAAYALLTSILSELIGRRPDLDVDDLDS